MPRGAKPGERRGGREKGRPNNKTITAVKEALQKEVEETGKVPTARKLGKEMLREFADAFASIMAQFQPKLMPGETQEAALKRWAGSTAEEMFHKYGTLAMLSTKEFTKYESATFKAIAVAPVPTQNPSEVRKRFTLLMFDRDARDPDEPRTIDGRVVKAKTISPRKLRPAAKPAAKA